MRPSLQDFVTGVQFLRRVPGFLRKQITHVEALETVQQRLRTRERDFLFLLQHAVYAHADNPFRRLLENAGCEYGDAERLVRAHGVEGALEVLYRNGVYLTSDELAGRTPVVRGRLTLRAGLRSLRNPWSEQHLLASTGGSSSANPGLLLLDLASLREIIPDHRLGFDAEGGENWVKALWTLPGSGGISMSLMMACSFGAPPARWFSPVNVKDAGLDPRYRLSATALYWVGRLLGQSFPRPEHVPHEEPVAVVHWIASVLRSGQTPYLKLHPSSAVRVCRTALEAGIDVTGAKFSLRGEPITPARFEAVSRAGVHCIPLYGTTECGVIGQACLAPRAVDEVHVHDDLHAMIQVGDDNPGAPLPHGALLMSSLRPTARLVLINACMGDVAVCEVRACGCPMESYGWKRHLHTIRSFEKLTGFGMTFADAEIVPALEQILPSRFGGGPTDYQLVEEEGEDGAAKLALVAHPRLGSLDETALTDAFITAIGEASATRRMMSMAWRSAGVVRVVRAPPLAAPSGKILHFRSRTPSAAQRP
jgi:hypothetical protein